MLLPRASLCQVAALASWAPSSYCPLLLWSSHYQSEEGLSTEFATNKKQNKVKDQHFPEKNRKKKTVTLHTNVPDPCLKARLRRLKEEYLWRRGSQNLAGLSLGHGRLWWPWLYVWYCWWSIVLSQKLQVMATDLADLRQMWWLMAEVCAAGGTERKVNVNILARAILHGHWATAKKNKGSKFSPG